jgi:hypothetical protein
MFCSDRLEEVKFSSTHQSNKIHKSFTFKPIALATAVQIKLVLETI